MYVLTNEINSIPMKIIFDQKAECFAAVCKKQKKHERKIFFSLRFIDLVLLENN